jgi:hypothetical protein
MMKAIVCLMLLLLAACAPAPAALVSSDAPLVAASRPDPSTALAPSSATPPPVASDPDAVSRACKVDADCAVKDVGSCCGRHPSCVNKDAATDPVAVRAQCQNEHRAGVCSMEAIGGCSCVQGQCHNINAAQMPGKH